MRIARDHRHGAEKRDVAALAAMRLHLQRPHRLLEAIDEPDALRHDDERAAARIEAALLEEARRGRRRPACPSPT